MKTALRYFAGSAFTLLALLAHAQEAAPEGQLAPQVDGVWIAVFGVVVLGAIAWFVVALMRNEKRNQAEGK